MPIWLLQFLRLLQSFSWDKCDNSWEYQYVTEPVKGGMIAGIVIGVCFFIAFIALLIWWRTRQASNLANSLGQNSFGNNFNTNAGQGTTIIYSGDNSNQTAYGMNIAYNQPIMKQPFYNQPIMMGNNYQQAYSQPNYYPNQGNNNTIIIQS